MWLTSSWFVRGGPVMWPLLVCSILSVTLVIERLIFWRRNRKSRDAALVDRIIVLTEKADYQGAIDGAANPADPVARVLVSGLSHRDHGLSEAMQIAAENEVVRMKQGLSMLDTVITMAPLLGILGTVTGIIRSFDLLGAADMMDPKGVSGGIAEALITTAAGLTIALISLVPFNYFVSRVQQAARELEQRATQFEVTYRRSQNKPCN